MVSRPLLVLAGPTASGKTALALHLAEALNGEIISCDSVAVYRTLDIGSAKPTPAERARVPHHCLDLYDPNEHPTAGDYARDARAALADIASRNRLPILAGGTGLYLRATLEGLAPSPPRNEALRARLRHSAERPGHLHRILTRLDARAAAAIHANDTPKLIRAIEVTLTGRRPQTEQWAAGRDPLTGFHILKLGLNPDRALLYDRINARCVAMFEQGLLAETEAIRTHYGDDCRALTTLGYAQALAQLRHELTPEQALAATQQGHRNYAKRQLTWFRRDTEMNWLTGPGEAPPIQHQAQTMAQTFLTS